MDEVLVERLSRIIDDIKKMESQIDRLSFDVQQLNLMASRWRGGFMAVLAIGGLLGTVISWVLDKFTN